MRPCTRNSPCRACEARDCDSDQECATGLLCADAHEAELTAIGLDPRKAYCDRNRGRWNWELCYDPKKLDCKVGSKCTECEARDCDTDAECGTGLLCADAHKTELATAGFDPRKAYCGSEIGEWNWELCYDPKMTSGCKNDTMCSDGNVCNGIEACNMTSGVCRPGPVLDCDDKNLCTVDSCDIVNGCIHTPKNCTTGQACDRLTGTCAIIENLRPCIAVIDESDNFADTAIDSKWLSFRTNFPNRTFCLLQPTGITAGRLYKPETPDFLTDPRVIFATVNRDSGNPALASDWLQACNLTDVALAGIDFVSLFVDESGSMTRATVQASLNKFLADLTAARLTYCSVYDGSEDWISPFNTALGSVGGGGACVVPT